MKENYFLLLDAIFRIIILFQPSAVSSFWVGRVFPLEDATSLGSEGFDFSKVGFFGEVAFGFFLKNLEIMGPPRQHPLKLNLP